jgi:predicted GIY-YIG superfamily endonuclease
MSDRRYFVYIMTSSSLSAMYIGVTNGRGIRKPDGRHRPREAAQGMETDSQE